jgi:hypothetical protein
VLCSGTEALPRRDGGKGRQTSNERLCWQVVEIATGHDSMISAPTQLLDIMEEVGRSS